MENKNAGKSGMMMKEKEMARMLASKAGIMTEKEISNMMKHFDEMMSMMGGMSPHMNPGRKLESMLSYKEE